ncbi:MAG: hypothetical protein E3J72_18670 [Planctomycetota bacterium]|nr:MAG: hypothetical protein E3J72_18670 [Planctomycetota bacterium]
MLGANFDHNVIVWRGLVIHDDMPLSVDEYIDEIMTTGSPLGARGGKGGPMRGVTLSIPIIPLHNLSPFEAARKVQEAGSDVKRYNDNNSDDSLGVCVCGDCEGAIHYSTRSSGTGLIIKVLVPRNRLVIDGRDFLYTALPMLCKADVPIISSVLPRMKSAFSAIIEDYIQAGRVLANNDQLVFRLTDYIIMDCRVINAQLISKVAIVGRYGTAFRSAFGIRGGIAPSEVVDVIRVDDIDSSKFEPPEATLGLSDLR